MSDERDYVLGTHIEEIERLGLQHRVWRPRVLDAWQRAGFTTGQTIVDAGCGPGYATLDLAEIVGANGRVVSVDRSRRFIDTLEANAAQRSLNNIDVHEADLDNDNLSAVAADGAWIRWVLAFVKQPQDVLRKVIRLLKPGGTIVIHEYFDYSTWRFGPRSEIFENFVAIVMETWRADGGEPDIALDLPGWLADEGLAVRSLKPIVEAISPASFIWQWPRTFVSVGLARLVELGRIDADEARRVAEDFAERESSPRALMFTPAVLEIIAVKD
jgi:SAM-dependent methyltransferase